MLTRRVRMLTFEQAARTFWAETADPVGNARRAFAKLEVAGLVHCVEVNARPELSLERPVLAWAVGERDPDIGAVAYRLQKRWTLPIRRTAIAIATRVAARRFGGHGGPLARPLQAGHDLHVTTVYLKYRQERPRAAADWLSESRLAPFRRHRKIPDAAIGKAPDRPRLFIEFGNGYDARRVEAFHRDCAAEGCPYELW